MKKGGIVLNEADNLRSVETDEKELLSENNIDEANIRINEVENESQEDEELEKEIEELKASSRKSFKTGMAIMVGSLLITLVCALIGSYMNAHYHHNPIKSQLAFIEQVCSYSFYLGLFFIIRYYIARRKIPTDQS